MHRSVFRENFIRVFSWFLVLLIIANVVPLPYRPDFSYTAVTPSSVTVLRWFEPFARFDSVHYLHIAQRGYVDEGRFFFGYPLFLRLITFGVVPQDVSVILGVLANVGLLAMAITVLWVTVRDQHTSLRMRDVALAIVLFPTGFFFLSLYSETLTLLGIALTLWAMKQRRWGWALLSAMMVISMRFVGIALLPILWWQWWTARPVSKRFMDRADGVFFLCSLCTLLPVIGFAYFNHLQWSDPLYFLHAHGALANGRATSSVVFVGQTLVRYIKILLSLSPSLYEWWVAALELSCVVWWGVTLWLGFRWKYPKLLIALSVLLCILPLSSGTFSGFPRYVLLSPVSMLVFAHCLKRYPVSLVIGHWVFLLTTQLT